jgi:hypothetical protein
MGTRIAFLTLAALVFCLSGCQQRDLLPEPTQAWQTDFTVDKANLASAGTNPYFVLEPGHTLSFSDGTTLLVISVLNETRTVDGVVTRVVEERETKNGQPLEISRNYFAIDKETKDVYYFGEDVDMYKEGKVTNHEGSWLAGSIYRFGLMMPGSPKQGQMFYQELAPRVAMDRCQIVATGETVRTPAGTFEHCLHVKESSVIESGTGEKWYAPQVGLVKDGDMELTKFDRAK